MSESEEIIVVKEPVEVRTINTIKVLGSVVHKFRPRDNVITLTVATSRHGADQADYPNITFYGDVADIIDKALDIRPGDYPRVCIDGMVQTTRRNINGQPRYFQNIIGHELRRTATNLERLTGKKIGTRKMDSINEVCILGKIVNIYEFTSKGSPIGTILTLKTVDNGKVNFPKVTCFGRIGRTAAGYEVGDYACIAGSIQTKQQNAEDRKVRYETIIASEIAKVE